MQYFKFFVIGLILILTLSFSGCVPEDNTGKIDTSFFSSVSDDVIMTPRLIEEGQLNSSIDVSKNVSPAVVGISSANNYSYSVGSGVAIANGGYILTNNHVVTGGDTLNLYLANGQTVSAMPVWNDATLDLAIIKSKINLPYLKIADDAEPKVGEDVLAIGTPLQLQFKHSITKGIVSALNRTVRIDGNGGESSLQSLIQHDASINPGNSGGPLINLRSQVVGINTLKIESAEGMGFAIPASVITNVLKNVLADGSYQSAYLGVFGYDSSIPHYYKKSSVKDGFYVLSVQEESPANLAGIKKGDVILAINDSSIKNMIDFKRNFFAYKAGDKITLKYMQDKHQKTVEITLKARPKLEEVI